MKKLLHLPLLLLSLLVVGCPSSAPTPPTAPAVVPYVLAWGGNGNPGTPGCSTITPTWCLLTYTLSEGSTVISNSIPETSSTLLLSTTSGIHTYSLTISAINGAGVTVHSPSLVMTVTVP